VIHWEQVSANVLAAALAPIPVRGMQQRQQIAYASC
jgi:hypothetical protein